MFGTAPNSSSSLFSTVEELCALLEAAPFGVVVLDESKVVLHANPSAQLLLGAGWKGYSIADRDGVELVRALTHTLEHGVAQRVELAQLPCGGMTGAFEAECIPVPVDDNARAVVVILRDMGERAALRKRLEQSNRFESLGKLAGSIAHDFNNLLTGIRGSLALAQQNISQQSHDAALRAADRAAQRASEMTRQLLTYTKAPARVSAKADVYSVLAEVTELVGCLPDGVQVDLELAPDLGLVDITPVQLHQIVLNLLLNARDAVRKMNPPGEVRLTVEPWYGSEKFTNTSPHQALGKSRQRSRWLQLTVMDNGPGMDLETRQKIFEPFFTTKAPGEGTGLGLSSVRDVVEQAGGWIDVQSQPPDGSTFHVYLPFASNQPKEFSVERAQQTDIKHDVQVLICDDETRLATLTAGLLEEFGYHPIPVTDGGVALRALEADPEAVDVLLLDVNLASEVTARGILEGMEQAGIQLPVILTSGLNIEDVPESLREHPQVVRYLAKPYTVDELVQAIERATRVRQRARRPGPG